MTDPKNEDIFSEEYDSKEVTDIEQTNPVEIEDLNTTEFAKGENNYSISKPKRIIIKAILKND